jgi:hypothetical protein
LALCALTWSSVLSAGCGDHPERLITGRWRESGWEYEKLAGKPAVTAKWIDGIDLPAFSERRVVHHEAEYWDFTPGGNLIIAKRDGTHIKARWRLKGRGHVLTVRAPQEEFEVYDVKQLDRHELVLNYDVGMEVRGIARLTFRRLENTELTQALRPLPGQVLRPLSGGRPTRFQSSRELAGR